MLEPTHVSMPRQNYEVGDVSPYTHHMYPACPTSGLFPGHIPQAYSETLSNTLWLVELLASSPNPSQSFLLAKSGLYSHYTLYQTLTLPRGGVATALIAIDLGKTTIVS